MIALFSTIELFILDSTKLGGAQVAYAKKEMVIGPEIGSESSGRSRAIVYAFALCHVFDKKYAVKHLQLFCTS